jgi:CRISPR-associated endonuclease Cas2
MQYYISYDISSTKLRNKLIKIIKQYASREQLSVFKSQVQVADINKLINAIKTNIITDMQYQDSILIIPYDEQSKKLFKISNSEDYSLDILV